MGLCEHPISCSCQGLPDVKVRRKYRFVPRMKQNDFSAMAVERLGHVAIRVENMARAKAFYQSIGLHLLWDAEDWCYLETRPGRDGLALLGPHYTAAGPHFAFHFTDRAAVDQVHAQLKAAGVAVGKVHDHRDGTASFYLQDPEGNWLEMLYEPAGGIPSND